MLFLSFLWIDWHIVIYLPKVPYLLLVICPRYLRDLYGNLLIFRVISPIDSEFSFLLYKIRVSGAIIWKIFTFLLYLKKSHPSVFFSPSSVPSENKICWWVSCHSQIGCLAIRIPLFQADCTVLATYMFFNIFLVMKLKPAWTPISLL